MTSKAIKGYKFVVGGKSRPGIIGVKPKSGGAIDKFKATKLKQLGKTQRTLQKQDKEMGEAVSEARKKGLSRKDAVKGKKFQRDVRRTQRQGNKLRKDVLRVGRKDGGMMDRQPRKPAPKKDGLKKPTPDQKGLQKLPEKVRNKWAT